ncbi:MAG: hypothetical protein M1828_005317 [Chrysothrix sp. TS-e1954]|nr:MAG: hypothetical protein M1828_005317 [Chrysothrix sp. TS-e1954]
MSSSHQEPIDPETRHAILEECKTLEWLTRQDETVFLNLVDEEQEYKLHHPKSCLSQKNKELWGKILGKASSARSKRRDQDRNPGRPSRYASTSLRTRLMESEKQLAPSTTDQSQNQANTFRGRWRGKAPESDPASSFQPSWQGQSSFMTYGRQSITESSSAQPSQRRNRHHPEEATVGARKKGGDLPPVFDPPNYRPTAPDIDDSRTGHEQFFDPPSEASRNVRLPPLNDVLPRSVYGISPNTERIQPGSGNAQPAAGASTQRYRTTLPAPSVGVRHDCQSTSSDEDRPPHKRQATDQSGGQGSYRGGRGGGGNGGGKKGRGGQGGGKNISDNRGGGSRGDRGVSGGGGRSHY